MQPILPGQHEIPRRAGVCFRGGRALNPRPSSHEPESGDPLTWGNARDACSADSWSASLRVLDSPVALHHRWTRDGATSILGFREPSLCSLAAALVEEDVAREACPSSNTGSQAKNSVPASPALPAGTNCRAGAGFSGRGGAAPVTIPSNRRAHGQDRAPSVETRGLRLRLGPVEIAAASSPLSPRHIER
jgi:hypothetical protein